MVFGFAVALVAGMAAIAMRPAVEFVSEPLTLTSYEFDTLYATKMYFTSF